MKIKGIDLYKKVLNKDGSILNKKFTNSKYTITVDTTYIGAHYTLRTWGLTNEGRNLLTDKTPLELDEIFSSEWEEVEEPVDFMSAVKSKKKVRVEHPYIEELLDNIPNNLDHKQDRDILNGSLQGEFMRLDYILAALGTYTDCGDLHDIILNGQWYVE